MTDIIHHIYFEIYHILRAKSITSILLYHQYYLINMLCAFYSKIETEIDSIVFFFPMNH